MKNIIILGSSGFIGSYLYKKLKRNRKLKIIGIDRKKNNRKDTIVNNIKKIDFKKIIQNENIDTIIDVVGFSGHNLLNRSIEENYLCKKNLVRFLKKTKKNIFYISFGTLYKFGKKNKISHEIYYNYFNSNDQQSYFKYLHEKKLFSIHNKNLRILIINLGSIFGNLSKINKNSNLIDKINFSLVKKKKFEIFYSGKERLKNVIKISKVFKKIYKEINLSSKKQKKKYREVNIVDNLVDLLEFAKIGKIEFIRRSRNNINNYFYYINQKKPKSIKSIL